MPNILITNRVFSKATNPITRQSEGVQSSSSPAPPTPLPVTFPEGCAWGLHSTPTLPEEGSVLCGRSAAQRCPGDALPGEAPGCRRPRRGDDNWAPLHQTPERVASTMKPWTVYRSGSGSFCCRCQVSAQVGVPGMERTKRQNRERELPGHVFISFLPADFVQ